MKKTFLLLVFFFSFVINGQNYVLDPTYGGNGEHIEFIYSVKPSKIYFENNSYYIINQRNSIISLNYDGSLNNNFGTNGQLIFSPSNIFVTSNINYTFNGSKFLNEFFFVYGTVTDSNLNNEKDIFIAKFSLNGLLDSSFGVNGIFVQDFGVSDEEITDILLLDNNEIIAVGNRTINSNTHIFISKYNSDGTIDLSFDVNGYRILQVPNATNYYGNNIFTYQNNILIVGYTGYTENLGSSNYNHKELVLANIDQNGNYINSFGTGGIILNQLVNPDTNGSIGVFNSSLLNENELFFGISSAFSFSSQYKDLNKYNFTTNSVEYLCGLPYEFPSYNIVDNQKIYITGAVRCVYYPCNRVFNLYRRNFDGTNDISFNNTGDFLYNFPSLDDDNSYSFYLHNDGKIFIAGSTATFSGILATLRIADPALTIQDNSIKNMIIIPNPVENELYIENIDKVKTEEISIYDVTGKEVFNINKGIEKIDVSYLDKGVYFIKINNDNRFYYNKFIKK